MNKIVILFIGLCALGMFTREAQAISKKQTFVPQSVCTVIDFLPEHTHSFRNIHCSSNWKCSWAQTSVSQQFGNLLYD